MLFKNKEKLQPKVEVPFSCFVVHHGCDHMSSLLQPRCDSLLHLKGPSRQQHQPPVPKVQWRRAFWATSTAKRPPVKVQYIQWSEVKWNEVKRSEIRPHFYVTRWVWCGAKLAVINGYLQMCAGFFVKQPNSFAWSLPGSPYIHCSFPGNVWLIFLTA